MAVQDVSGRRIALDRSAASPRAGSIGLVLLVALALVGAALALLLIGRGRAEPYIIALLAVLATIGVFSLFALAAGILRFFAREQGNPLIRAMVDGAFDGVVMTDAGGRVVYANRAYLDLVDAADANDVRPIERVFIGDPDVSEAVFRLLKAAREGKRLQEEVRVAGPNGEPARWLRLRVRPLDADQKGFTVWAIADVTRERERHENIFQELQHAIDYLDHAPAGFFSVDAAGNVVYLNATLAGWLDHDLAQVGSGGLALGDIVAGDGAALITTVAAAPGEVKTETLDLDLKTRGGQTLPVRLVHKVAFGADGAPGASRTLVLDRVRGEERDAHWDADVRFTRFFHNTPMAIATVDASGRIARTNARFAKLFEGLLRGEEAAGERSILSVVAVQDRPTLEAAIRKAAAGQGDIPPVDAAFAGEIERWADFYVSAIKEEERDADEAAIVYALETTGQRSLAKQLAQAQKMEMVGTLAAGIAHDFNNQLQAITMATDFLLIAHKPTDPSFQDIMQIKQNVNRAAGLVLKLLAFSRRQTLRPSVVDLREGLSDMHMMLRRLIPETVKVELVHGRDLWPIKVDMPQFEQVIVNLAVNARDAMPDGGRLTLRTSNVTAEESARFANKGMPAADYVLVEVADTGTGIPPEIIDRIFEPFFSTKEVGKGTGLGLSMVYGFVKQTGGFVYVDSAAGEGTTFRIFLPRYVPGRGQPAEVPEAEPPALATAMAAVDEMVRTTATDLTGQGTILLVEDEEGLRALNGRGLISRGYSVLEAGNGVEALEVLEQNDGRVDLVVSDVVMPEMDGPTLLKELRKRNPQLKIIFVSGYAEDAFEKNLPEGGQFAFLPKPFTLKQLVAKVKETLEG